MERRWSRSRRWRVKREMEMKRGEGEMWRERKQGNMERERRRGLILEEEIGRSRRNGEMMTAMDDIKSEEEAIRWEMTGEWERE